MFVSDAWCSDNLDVSFQHAETLVVRIYKINISYVIFALYRPPSSNVQLFCDEFSEALKKYDNNEHLVIAGDFNIDVLDEARPGVSRYLDTLASFGLENTINNYTREEYYGTKLTKSCIDHIIIRISNLHSLSGVIKQKVADHYITVLLVLGENTSENSTPDEAYRTILNSKLIDSLIQQFDWKSLLDYNHIIAYDTVVDKFQDIYVKATKRVKLKRRKAENIWITDEILELCHQKERLWNRCKQNPADSLLKREFREFRNRVTAKIRLAKKKYCINQFNAANKNSKKTWELVNQLTGRKTRNNIDDTILKHFRGSSSWEGLSESFNNTFIDSVKKLKNNIPVVSSKGVTTPVTCANSAYLPDMTEHDLLMIINSMSLTKSPGIDKIRIRDIRYNFNKLKEILLKIINDVLHTGDIPKKLKVSIIRPLYKKGKQQDLGSYRPISILPVLMHIIEKWVHMAMSSFCEKFSLLSKTQYGFRQQRSTLTLLEDFSDYIHDAIDNNKTALALFIDLSKAFDTIDHSLLLQKLEKLGFRGPFSKFFESYFTDRFQMVKIMNHVSNKISVDCGVPQGSTLGPMLYNVYTNDLGCLPFASEIFQYADDTVLLLPSDNYENSVSLFQKDVDTLLLWFAVNMISVNVPKTKLVCFRNPHKRVQLSPCILLHTAHCHNCNCLPLPYSRSVKYLGIYFDEHMLWNEQIDYIIKRLRVISANMYKLKFVSSLRIRLLVFRSLVESTLRYGITVYGHCSRSKMTAIDRVLKQIVNHITYGTGYETLEMEEKVAKLGILFFEKFHIFATITQNFFNKTFKNKVAKTRVLRHTERYVVPKVYTHYGKRTRNHYIPTLFNRLPQFLIAMTSLKKIKLKLKTWCHSLMN